MWSKSDLRNIAENYYNTLNSENFNAGLQGSDREIAEVEIDNFLTLLTEDINDKKISTILNDILIELDHADTKYRDDRMVEAQVGLDTIKCELMELQREIHRSTELRRPKAMRKEAIQVAAMAIKFLRDICK